MNKDTITTRFFLHMTFIFSLALFFPCLLCAQEFVCHMNEEDDFNSVHDPNLRGLYSCTPGFPNSYECYNSAVYYPSSSDTPIPIRLNLFFLQRNDGTGNFQQNNEDHQLFLDLAMEKLNNQYAHLVQDLDSPYCYVGASFISDAKVHFDDHRYYIKDEYGWNWDSISPLCPGYADWHLCYLDNQICQCDTIQQGINVYFTEIADHYQLYESGSTLDFFTGGCCSRDPSFINLNHSSRVHIPEYFSLYWHRDAILNPNNNDSIHNALRELFSGWLANALAHELGHSFYLNHPGPSSHDAYEFCSNYIMIQAGASPRNFLSPAKIARIHYSLMGSNLQNYVPENAYSGIKIVAENVSFPRMRFYHSLSIQADVTMNCDVIMPKQATISVQNGGTLSINGGNLHSKTDSWNGIVVEDGGTLILSNISITDYNIVVEDGGKLVIPNDITLLGEHYIRIKNGGCICVDEQAIITLTSPFSAIELFPYALIGCNNITSAHCVDDIEDISISGNGTVVTYDSVNYIQNETISSDSIVTGSSVLAGYNVTDQKPVGNVVVTSSGDLRIQAIGDVTITRDVEVQQGGSLTIQTNP